MQQPDRVRVGEQREPLGVALRVRLAQTGSRSLGAGLEQRQLAATLRRHGPAPGDVGDR